MKKIDLTKLVATLSIGALGLVGCKSDPEPAPAAEGTAPATQSSCGQGTGTAPAGGGTAPAGGAQSCGQGGG